MKKIIIVLFIFVLISLLFNHEKQIRIPDDSIRFRIIANSNTLCDQEKKAVIRNDIEPDIMNVLKEVNDINVAKEKLNEYLPILNQSLTSYNVPYKINLGQNYFPEKDYKGIKYDAGNYESLVITLGDGLGDNWWCVLFPPLCLLEAEENNMTDIDYQLYISKILEKF